MSQVSDEDSRHGTSATSPAQISGQGCLVCRSRKIRCDRGVPSCKACVRLRIRCPGYQTPEAVSDANIQSQVDNIFKASGVERRRVGSCQNCYRSKLRCSKTRPSCQRCIQKGFNCVYSNRYSINVVQEQSPNEQSGEVSESSPDTGSRRSFSIAQTVDEGIQNNEDDGSYENIGEEFSWLYHDSIPSDTERKRRLFKLYFSRIHTLRCLGFIHTPAFRRSFDRGTLEQEYSEPLIYMICAFGAMCLYFDNPQLRCLVSQYGMPGRKWADRATSAVLQGIQKPSLVNLMSMILVCEYGVRTEKLGMVFQLIGTCYRLVRLLGLCEMKSSGESVEEETNAETQKRLVWSCYLIDNMVGSGVSANLSWPKPPSIPLPVDEQEFLTQASSRTREALIPECFDSPDDANAQNLRSHIIYLTSLRGEVLRLIREHRTVESICCEGSDFLTLMSKLDTWYENLPRELGLAPIQLYTHRDMNVLGAVVALHLEYHASICSLTRVSLNGFDFPLAEAIRAAPVEFRAECQRRCIHHSNQISHIIHLGLEHGAQSFDDALCHVAAFEATKVQIVWSAINGNDSRKRAATENNIRTNIKLMEMEEGLSREILNRAVFPLLSKFGFSNIVGEWSHIRRPGGSNAETTDIVGPSEASYLTTLSTFRRARLSASVTSQDNSPSGEITTQPTRPAYLDDRPPQTSAGSGGIDDQSLNAHPVNDLSMITSPSQIDEGFDGYMHGTPDHIMAQQTANPSMEWLSQEEYMRLAMEMSDYLVWDMEGFPDSDNFPDHGGL